MSDSPIDRPDAQTPKRTGLFGWFDQRTGLDGLLREALDEPIPGGARFAYVFGSALLFIFISQVITGVVLTLYYVPSADHAHTTVAYITKEVTSDATCADKILMVRPGLTNSTVAASA